MRAWVRSVPLSGVDHVYTRKTWVFNSYTRCWSKQPSRFQRVQQSTGHQRRACQLWTLKQVEATAGAPFCDSLPEDCSPEKSLEWGQRLLAYSGRFRQGWCTLAPQDSVTPIDLFDSAAFEEWIGKQSHEFQSWLRSVESLSASGSDPRELFCQCVPELAPPMVVTPEPSSLHNVPHTSWSVLARADVPFSRGALRVPWQLAAMPARVPPGTYYIRQGSSKHSLPAIALAWALGNYVFDAYKTRDPWISRKLVWQVSEETSLIETTAEAAFLVRDLINAPAEHMGPAALEACARALTHRHKGSCRVVRGDALLAENFPQVHAVGRAASMRHEPRLIELHFSDQDASRQPDPSLPLVVVIGKGVTFDSGGLDIKPAQAMRLMKKDMGGAAHALGLAHLLRAEAELAARHRLCVLLPAVENAISGGAFRPGDVLAARNGITTEIGNTDAEGRLILADALVYAMEMQPAFIIDFATLTGAARVALGTDLPALFCTHDQVAQEAVEIGSQIGDPVWHMPLHRAYRRMLRSKVADIQNVAESPYAGAILAALYLAEFVKPERKAVGEPLSRKDSSLPADRGNEQTDPVWLHMDLMAYAVAASAGRPEGGIEQGLYTLYHLLRRRILSATSS